MLCFAFERTVSKNRVIRTSSSRSLSEKIANKEYMFACNSYEKLYLLHNNDNNNRRFKNQP